MIRLGVTKTENGFQFAFATAKEEGCSLLLYKKGKPEPEKTIAMEQRLGDIYVAEVKGLRAEQYEYVYRVGEKRVMDPYATGISGRKKFGQFVEDDALRCTFDESVYDWGEDKFLKTPISDSLIYCTHLRGYTMDRSSGVKKKGTFAGMIEKIPYLQSLGIRQLELMPVYEFEEFPKPKTKEGMYEQIIPADRRRLNYWGYTEGFYFAPKATYASGKNPGTELKDLVKALHAAGIELILEFYFGEATAPNFIMDCLRYWVEEYHIDGIHVNRSGSPLKNLAMDPALKRTKIFSEYFDVSELAGETRNVERKHLIEYNDGFLMDARRLLKGDEDVLRSFVERTKKNPEFTGIVNYMASHNGFTMMDMVSYDEKHNEANGENNQDGTSYNYSWNCGVEGVCRKKSVQQLRYQQLRNAFAMVLLAQGIPMIYGGDEFGNSQQGNNNVYGQDNELSWVQWSSARLNVQLQEFVKEMIAFRKNHGVFHEKKEAAQSDYKSTGYPDVSYHGESAWYGDFEAYRRQIGILYGADYAEHEENVIYVACNLHWIAHNFGLPNLPKGKKWKVIFNSMDEKQSFSQEGEDLLDQRVLLIPGRSIWVLEGK